MPTCFAELMRSNGLSQMELAKPVGIAQSTVSAVLTVLGSLTKGQILKLAEFFGNAARPPSLPARPPSRPQSSGIATVIAVVRRYPVLGSTELGYGPVATVDHRDRRGVVGHVQDLGDLPHGDCAFVRVADEQLAEERRERFGRSGGQRLGLDRANLFQDPEHVARGERHFSGRELVKDEAE